MRVENIRYELAGRNYLGALVYEDNQPPRPAVLMGPNWMGVTDKAVDRAKLLAAGRYVVFVADMYGECVRPSDFPGAAALANPLRENPAEARRRVRAGYETMVREANKRGLTNDRRAAIGFCFGGGNVLDLARDGADLQATVAVHSDLKTVLPANKGDIKGRVLIIHGAPDPVVPKADRDAIESELDAAGASWQMHLFSGLLHAYTDQGADVPGIAGYDEPGARQTYALTHAFIADALAGKL
jgi:dienelactone hydrolase